MGIFFKGCPQCAATLRADVGRCACGYLFDLEPTEDVQLTIEQAANEEKLYEQYLAARAAQADEAARVAVTLAAMDPGDERKAVEAGRAEAAANAGKAELAAQRMRAAQAAEAAARVANTPRNALRGIEVVEDENLVEEYLAARAEQARQADTTQVASSHQPVRLTVKSIGAAPMAAGTDKPGKTIETGTVNRANPESVDQSEEPGAALKAAQSAKASKIMKEAMAAKPMACPWCTATLPASAARCRCGYSLQIPNREVPPLTLSADERAALVGGLDIKKPPQRP